MESVGERLKQARTEQNRSLEEIFEETRISVQHLQYLESNRFDFLPQTYVKSYLKCYARELGLDPREMLAVYEASQAEARAQAPKDSNGATEEVAPARLDARFLEWMLGAGMLLLLILMVVAYLQYRSQIYAASARANTELGAVAVPRLPHEAGLEDNVLEITARGPVWFYILAGEEVREFHLLPQQKVTWTSDEAFDVLLGSAGGVHIKWRHRALENLGRPGEKVLLSITRDGEVKRRPVVRQRYPSSYLTN